MAGNSHDSNCKSKTDSWTLAAKAEAIPRGQNCNMVNFLLTIRLGRGHFAFFTCSQRVIVMSKKMKVQKPARGFWAWLDVVLGIR